mgnify:CR=1 FL=1
MLNIKNTIIDFLYDKNYFITMYENFLYIYIENNTTPIIHPTVGNN